MHKVILIIATGDKMVIQSLNSIVKRVFEWSSAEIQFKFGTSICKSNNHSFVGLFLRSIVKCVCFFRICSCWYNWREIPNLCNMFIRIILGCRCNTVAIYCKCLTSMVLDIDLLGNLSTDSRIYSNLVLDTRLTKVAFSTWRNKCGKRLPLLCHTSQ